MSTRVPNSADIDFSDWGFIQNMDDWIDTKKFANLVTEAIEETFKDNPPAIYFPTVWDDTDGYNNPAPSDPLTVYIDLYFSSEVEACSWSTTLNESLDSYLEDCEHDGSFKEGLQRIAIGLRQLADRIDKVCNKHD